MEAILSKYRNMNQSTTITEDESLHDIRDDLESSNNGTVKSQVQEQDAVFNEEYKFNDAKRKLRSVLSKCSITMLNR